MVINYLKTRLSKSNTAAIAAAVKEAEAVTKAEIIVSHLRASNHYHTIKIIYGLAIGTFVALIANSYANFQLTQILIIQLVITTILSFIPAPRFFIPNYIKNEKAFELACKEYYILDKNTPANQPFVLFFISSFEKYSHILVSDSISAKIGDEVWQGIINNFTASVKPKGRGQAIVETVKQISNVLSQKF